MTAVDKPELVPYESRGSEPAGEREERGRSTRRSAEGQWLAKAGVAKPALVPSRTGG